MRSIGFAVIVMMMLAGCAHLREAPVVPSSNEVPVAVRAVNYFNPHHLWGEWTFYIPASHDRVDVVPRRNARLHLNALKFLESYCSDCLKVTSIVNNGDSTIDLGVRIKHPFAGHPEYTGFDVKGVIMFQGSHEIPENLSTLPLYPENYRLSWRLMGDPELLNADGFTYLWSPWYDSGSDLPVFNYWPGKYSSGTPTANVNGFLNFYTMEDRHIFETDKSVERTYHIWLPQGPITAGYAVDACWAPPDVTPVTDPVTDFPVSANQPELYYFKLVINDGQPVTHQDWCCDYTVYDSRAETRDWYVLPPGDPVNRWVGAWNESIEMDKVGIAIEDCDEPPDHPEWRCFNDSGWWEGWLPPDGVYQVFAHEFHAVEFLPQPPYYRDLYPAFDVFEIIVDYE